MATEILMPRQGNTVESCIILSWKKKEGDEVKQGDVLCEVETDKATFEVEAPSDGTLLKVLYPEGADVPVLKLIAVVGRKGEDLSAVLERAGDGEPERRPAVTPESPPPAARNGADAKPVRPSSAVDAAAGISPRARNLADAKGIDFTGIHGSGPGGRIIERDVAAALGGAPEMTPAAIAAHKAGGGPPPAAGTGIGGRVTVADVEATGGAGAAARRATGFPGPTEEIAVQGIRKRIADRMLQSLQATAQVTLDMPADARAILAYRARLKSSDPDRGLAAVNLNDIVLFAVSRSLLSHPDLNAHFLGEKIVQFERVHLGFAVDTPRGLVVPVIRNADLLSLREIAAEAKRLAAACVEGQVTSDELTGATFTVSNLGALGIEHFTPVLNPPQVGIVGVGAVSLRPEEKDGGYEFVPHLPLSLTIDHQAVDGAPGARFLRTLATNIATFDLLLAE